jgi:hypothetical protein
MLNLEDGAVCAHLDGDKASLIRGRFLSEPPEALRSGWLLLEIEAITTAA